MIEEFTSCCFTGYRPNKFPFSLKEKSREYIKFENALNKKIFELIEEGCYTFTSGMAMGFDIIAAENVILAKKACKNASIKLICAIPFIEQSETFSKEWKKRYDKILSAADDIILTSDTYYKGCYEKRNQYMVDNSDYVITWFDGKPSGTKNTIEYAKKIGRTVINLYDDNGNIGLPSQEFILE